MFQVMLSGIRQRHAFTFDEYKIMLSLHCGVDLSQGDAGVAKAVDRNYRMYLIELHGLEIEKGNQ